MRATAVAQPGRHLVEVPAGARGAWVRLGGRTTRDGAPVGLVEAFVPVTPGGVLAAFVGRGGWCEIRWCAACPDRRRPR